jgi:hypothetical protein
MSKTWEEVVEETKPDVALAKQVWLRMRDETGIGPYGFEDTVEAYQHGLITLGELLEYCSTGRVAP